MTVTSLETKKLILDATAGWRQMWVDKECPFAVFADQKSQKEVSDSYLAFEKQRGNNIAKPLYFKNATVQYDFRRMIFPDNSFKLIVFDPPQALRLSPKSFLFKKYGCLCAETWQSDLKKAAAELWRVLAPEGVLIFKWSDTDIPIESVLSLFPVKPLFGQTTSKSKAHSERFAYTYWFTFMKIPGATNF